MMMIRDYRNNN